MISIDPTEARSTDSYQTRLPDSVVDAAVQIPGLEQTTGADIIVSAQALPPDLSSDPLPVPARRMLQRAAKFAVFVQRKSGGDFLNSIPHLAEIEERMQGWCRPGACWLLVTSLNLSTGNADGRDRDWTPEAVQGALLWWQLRGGHVAVLPDDSSISAWIEQMHQAVLKIEAEPVKWCCDKRAFAQFPPLQQLEYDAEDWRSTGSAFPRGWGEAKREAVWQALTENGQEPTLLNAISIVCNKKIHIAGIGPKLTQALQEWVGYKETS